MILDHKHKLYDLEFNLAESFAVDTAAATNSGTNNSNTDGGNNARRRNQVMDSIKEEIQELEKEKKLKMEQEVQIKYGTRTNNDVMTSL